MPLFSRTPADPDSVNALSDEFEDLRTASNERLARMKQYRDEGQSARGSDLMSSIGQSTEDYGRARRGSNEVFRHRIPLPFGKALNVKHAYRISGKLPDVVVDRRDESPEERYRSDTMEKIVWAIMRASRGSTQFSSGAWDGSELGATCFDLYYDIGSQIPKFRACDPMGLLEVQGVDDPHDFQRVYRFWDVPKSSLLAAYRDQVISEEQPQTPRLGDITPSHTTAGIEMVTIAQMCDKTKLVRFVPQDGVKLFERKHDLGFVPYVIIPNVGPERDVWGWADYEFIRAIAGYISTNFAREADILRAVANGTYIEKGTGQAPEVIQSILAEGGVVPARRDGELKPVDPPDVPQFASDHMSRAMEMFKMLGFAPDAAWGAGFSGSAADRGLMLQPLVEFTAMKQLNWEAGLGRLFAMAYRMLESKLTGTATYRGSKPSSVGNRRLPFSFQLGSKLDPLQQQAPAGPEDAAGGFGMDGGEMISLPRTPKELFDGDYEVRFLWNNRIDPDDPSYVLSELNKFQHGAQSLETTLERLGFEAPQDEMKRIETEADRFPWINQGMVALIRAQLSSGAQGDGGGPPADPTGDLGQATDTASTAGGGALGADAAAQALGAQATGPSGGWQ